MKRGGRTAWLLATLCACGAGSNSIANRGDAGAGDAASQDSSTGPGPDGAALRDSGAAENESGADGALPNPGQDASALADAGGDASATAANPPPGSTPCGGGTFTATDSASSCQLYSNFLMAAAENCNEVTVTGGAWEAWCSPTSIYLWARFDGLSIPNAAICAFPVDGGEVMAPDPIQLGGTAMTIELEPPSVAGNQQILYGSAEPRSPYGFINPTGASTGVLEGTVAITESYAFANGNMWLVGAPVPCPFGMGPGAEMVLGGVPLNLSSDAGL